MRNTVCCSGRWRYVGGLVGKPVVEGPLRIRYIKMDLLD